MAKDRHPEIQAALENAVEKCDLDGVFFRLTEIAVKKRDAATDNKTERDYWQRMISVLHDAEERASVSE